MVSNFKLRVRRDTAANWTSLNPILGLGEPGWDITNGNLKIGDGITPWNSLQVASTMEIAYYDITPSSPMPVAGYGELMETIQTLRMSIDALTKSVGAAYTDGLGRLRVTMDSTSGGLNAVGTVTNLTTLNQIAALNAQDLILAASRLPADTLRNHIVDI